MPEWMNIGEMGDNQPEKRMHMERYEYAASVLSGKRVLDCACGMGYGTDILSRTCAPVGVDIDPAAIATAQAQYPGLCFRVGDIYTVELSLFDALVAFETIEHLAEPESIIERLPDNIEDIVISAPIRPTVGWNPWHKSDFTHGTLCALVERKYRVVYVQSQPWVDGKGDLYLIVHGRRGNWVL